VAGMLVGSGDITETGFKACVATGFTTSALRCYSRRCGVVVALHSLLPKGSPKCHPPLRGPAMPSKRLEGLQRDGLRVAQPSASGPVSLGGERRYKSASGSPVGLRQRSPIQSSALASAFK